MAFSDRIGITEPKSVVQVEAMDADLRNGLWQACIENYFRAFTEVYTVDHRFRGILQDVYVNFFKMPSDEIPWGHDANIATLRKWFFDAKWWQVYNLIEFLAGKNSAAFVDRVTFFLEREKSGYRFIDKQLVPISDPIEIDAVTSAASIGDPFAGARQHIQAAVSLFSKKPSPDYRNAIKEAISSVEATGRIITGNPKSTLGEALKQIDSKVKIHPALRDAMNKLYGYSSDEGGIRHAMLEESNIDEAEAKFMIVACSAFVNFCVQRSSP